jgi:ABC-type multidrug transport system permease subunit
MIRDPMAFRVQILQSIFIATMFGLVYFQLTLNQKGVQNIGGVLFLSMTNMSFSSIFAVVNTFPAEIPVFLREHQNRMYRVISFYLSKILLDIPTFVLVPTIFITIIYWMAALSDDVHKFFVTAAILIIVAQTACAVGTFVSVTAPNTNAALAIAAPVMVPLMIFSGYLLNTDDIPKYFLFLRYLSWFSYANENLFINQFSDVTSIACDNPAEECQKQFRNGEDVLNFFKMDSNNFYSNIACMIGLIVGWRILAFLVLLIKSRKQS